MITDIFLSAVFIIANFAVSPLLLFPDATLPTSLTSSIANIQGFLATANSIFPVDTLLQVLGVLLTVEVAIFTYKGIMWLIKKIPTIS